MNNSEKYSALAAKYLAGQASPTEQQELFAWRDAVPTNQKHFEEWTQVWALIEGAGASPFEADLSAAWSKLDAAISDGNTLAEVRPTPKIVHLSKIVRRWSVAAAVLFAVAATAWWFTQQPEKAQFVEVQTVGTEKKQVTLPDSSRVWLNGNTKLVYNPSFEQRHVTLEGEAFFEVERMEARPFEITSGQATTTVLGTSFNVRAYPTEERIEVTVKTGKVALAVTNRKESPVLLTPGETGIFDKKEDKVKVATVEIENADAWKTQQLVFDDEKMAQVIASLERYFNADIEVSDPTLLECPYTSAFEQPDLEGILTVIGSTIGFEFSKTEGRYLLTGKGCNQ